MIALAAHRLTRLIVEDDLPPVQAARGRLIGWAGKDSVLAEGLRCSWCAGYWVALATAAAALRWPRARKVLLPFAISSVVGLLGTLDGALGRVGSD